MIAAFLIAAYWLGLALVIVGIVLSPLLLLIGALLMIAAYVIRSVLAELSERLRNV